MMVRAVPPTDRIDHEGEAVVLVGAQVVRLSALATTVLDLAVTWRGDGELAARLVAAHGPPPGDADPQSATRAVLEQLVAHGLLERDETAP
ncbi:hypothetical protein [Knoellia koreensis]|uniref:PqqD family protein n=1 Tax=Knoellia koreensis TaxID=2730921 RepID=A0A849H9U7_9MICO|nr:hypothetical protein [Knoellia sp. DB2414S]NNM46506.1 hypothetical protein [Knoellia sp. DB2414S]